MIQIDMPMPKNCRMCPACSEYDICLIPIDGKGFGEQNVSEFIDSRPEWCPLKEQKTETELCDRCGRVRLKSSRVEDKRKCANDKIAALEQKLKEQEEDYSKLAKTYLSLAKRAAHRPNIVRCKDCVNRHDSINCRMFSEGMDTKDDWFCADGERRNPK